MAKRSATTHTRRGKSRKSRSRKNKSQNSRDQLANEARIDIRSDALTVLTASPRRLFAHWTLAHDAFKTLRAAFGDSADSYRLGVRVRDELTGEAHFQPASDECAAWLEVDAGRDYRVEVGFAGDNLPFVTVLSSPTVQSPRDQISFQADNSEQFKIAYRDFLTLLDETGFDAYDLDASFVGSSEQNIL